MLLCPICKNKLTKFDHSYKCCNNHCYDISKEGYVNLLLSKTDAGDNKDLIKARVDFLDKGYYYNLASKLQEILTELKIDTLLDAGCGTGYYTDLFKGVVNNVYGSDISKEAIKSASKKNKNIQYIVASSQNIPFKEASFDAIVNIFAPYFEDEFKRLLKEKGYLIIVHTGKEHLWQLKQLVYANPYLNEDANYLFNNFSLQNEYDLKYQVNINSEDLKSLFMMTPYYYKTKNEDFLKIGTISSLNLTIHFKITIFRLK